MSRQRDYISTVVTDHPLRHPTLTRVYGFGLRLGPRGSGFEVVGYQRSGFLIWCLESDLPRKGRGSSPQPPPREHLEPPATPIYDVKAGNHAAGMQEQAIGPLFWVTCFRGKREVLMRSVLMRTWPRQAVLGRDGPLDSLLKVEEPCQCWTSQGESTERLG